MINIATYVLLAGLIVLVVAALRAVTLWYLRLNEIIERLATIERRLDTLLSRDPMG